MEYIGIALIVLAIPTGIAAYFLVPKFLPKSRISYDHRMDLDCADDLIGRAFEMGKKAKPNQKAHLFNHGDNKTFNIYVNEF